MALYGRGLAELLEGRKQDGEADMLGAGAFSTEVKDSFRRMGLTPEQIGEVAPGRP